MPYKNQKKKRPARRKRTYARRRKRTPSRPLSGFPTSKIVKLRYVDSNLTLDPGSGLTAGHTYMINSVFDPDYTGTGHQPMGFDEWAAIYTRYTVLGAKVSVVAKPTGTGNIIAPVFGVILSPTGSPLSQFTTNDNILESKLTQGWKVASMGQPSGMGKNTYPTVVKYFSAKKFFGVKDIVDGAAYGASVTTNPVKQAFINVWSMSIDGGNAGEMTALVTIDYIVKFSDPALLDGS